MIQFDKYHGGDWNREFEGQKGKGRPVIQTVEGHRRLPGGDG